MGFFKNTKDDVTNIKTGYLYDALPEKLKTEYEKTVSALMAYQKKIQIPSVESKEEMEKIINAILLEQPQLFYINPRKIGIQKTGSQYAFLIEYIYDKKTSVQLLEQIEEKAQFILSQIIIEGMTDYEKCLAIHDYMTENIRYNFSALTVSYVYDAFSIEGSILKNQAVCEGIAKGIAFLLNKLNIPNIIVAGFSDIDEQRVAHAWNMVMINDAYYHIDATWDLQEVNHFTNHSHMYFNLDDESLLGNHFWELQDYPSCDSNDENYYIKEKRFFRTFRSFELYLQKILKENQDYIDVRFEDILDFSDDGGRVVSELIKKNAGYLGKSYEISFVFNPDNYVFQADISYSE